MTFRFLAALLLLQVATPAPDAAIPAPQHFRYERDVSVPAGVSGQTCATLDGTVFAHAAKQSLDDLRLYTHGNTEIPFIITESGSARFSDEAAEVRNASTRGGNIVFDLYMPTRRYTAVQLNINAKDFFARATVTGSNGDEPPTQLGQFALFDLSSGHLSRSTILPLQESSFRNLHITLSITASPGTDPRIFPPSIVKGATIPPSREAQTLYTAVATAPAFTIRGRQSITSVHIPAHVPVERFTFDLDPAFTQDFLRNVSITARPDTAQDTASVEAIPGSISQTKLPRSLTGDGMAEGVTQLTIDAVLGANLREGATIDIAIEDKNDAPLPLRDVQLGMRERRICFDAVTPPYAYTLRYGDDALKPALYEYARLFTAARAPAIAHLGPDHPNPSFRPRTDTRTYSGRHPEVLWLALIAAVVALGTVARRTARRRH